VSENFGENANYARQETAFLEDIAACCSQNRLDVLSVFCLPKECEKIKNLLYAKAEGVTFVEIKEEFATLARAKEFLKALAKKGGFKPDRKLYAKLKENEQYSTAGLRSIFSDWMNNNLKTSVYPQYKDFTDGDRTLATQAPSGLAIDELNAMIGLGGVKDTVARTIDFFNAQSLLRSHGVAVNKPMLHMVFTGNPGTAKTTVARLFGRILKDNGILARDVFVEVGRGDLVGKYVGSTAPLVKDKFKAAEGGVLFIDEAYSLVDDRDGLYGDEAINTIVQEMENRRDSVCVIFAGYPDKMEKFLDKNPGLRSRIAAHIRFEDYSTEELLEIAKLLAKKQGLELTSGAAQNLTALFDEAREQKDFGNGRYVRNVLDRAKMTHSSRIVHSDLDALKPADYTLLTAQDIELPKASPKSKKICGFCA